MTEHIESNKANSMPDFLHGLISTIIPVYNRPEMLKQAVASVLQQTYKAIEIIIVNDGSTDNTGSVADQLAEELPDRVRVLHINNGGPGFAREAGRQVARGEFIQYLDSDDLLLPRKFEMQVEVLRNHEECGIAYGITQLIDEQDHVLKSPYKWTGRKIDFFFPALLVDRWWSTHTPLYRRSVCDSIGSWTDMYMGEDWEYDARIGALGVRLISCQEPVSQHRQHNQPRLTGLQGYSDKTLVETCHLMKKLYECSQRVGIKHNTPEMRHFSRWAFLMSRRAGSAGLKAVSQSYFEIALKSSGEMSHAKMNIYYLATRIFGWIVVGSIAMKVDNFFHREPSSATMKLSWRGDSEW